MSEIPVDELIRRLSDPDPDVRFDAVEHLAGTGRPALAALEQALATPDPVRAVGVAEAVLRIARGHAGAARRLLEILRTAGPEVRRAAARALGEAKRQPERAWAGLLPALEDDDPHVSSSAAVALYPKPIRPPAEAAVPALARALVKHQDWETRVPLLQLCNAYGRRSARALGALLAVLRDFLVEVGDDYDLVDTWPRMAANALCWALAKIGRRAHAAVPLLEDLLQRVERDEDADEEVEEEDPPLSLVIREALWRIQH